MTLALFTADSSIFHFALSAALNFQVQYFFFIYSIFPSFTTDNMRNKYMQRSHPLSK